MLALAASTSPASLIAAVGSGVSALVLAYLAIRAQSAKEQLNEIRRIVEEELHQQLDPATRGLIIGEWVKKALREVLGRDPRARRWYDDSEDC